LTGKGKDVKFIFDMNIRYQKLNNWKDTVRNGVYFGASANTPIVEISKLVFSCDIFKSIFMRL